LGFSSINNHFAYIIDGNPHFFGKSQPLFGWITPFGSSEAQIGPSLLCSIPMTGLIRASPGATTTSLGCNGLGRCSINGGGLTTHHDEVMLVLLVDRENGSKMIKTRALQN
jgi:hypothetical protein